MTPSHLLNGRISKSGQVLPFLIALFALPNLVFASVQITEIMYDVSGGDSGREWIEITNTGSEAVDVSKFRLGEADTNHKLAVISGSAVLPPGGSAVIASDPAKFKTDWPLFAGVLLDSTFSLSNTGETLTIKNASSSVQDSISYAASMGAAGDGGSLQRQGDSFIAALPTLGIFPGEIKAVPKVTKAPTAPKTTSAKTSSTKSSPTQTAAAGESRVIFDPSAQSDSTPAAMTYWILGLVALVALGIAGAVFARISSSQEMPFGVTKPKEEEFSLIEN